MNEEQVKLAINAGLKMFAPGSNVTGIDMTDVTGIHCLKQLLLLLANGQVRLIPSALLEKQPEPPKEPEGESD